MRFAALLLLLISFVPAPEVSARTPFAVTGQVTGPGGTPVAGARVLLLPVVSLAASIGLELDGKAQAEPVAAVSTDAQGGFRLAAPETGLWKVVVEARELVPKELLLTPLVGEEELPPVKLVRDAKLEVRVSGPDGRPRSGVRIRIDGGIVEVDDELYRRVWRVPARMARTDSKGMAVLPREPGEKLLVQAGADGLPAAGRTEVAGGSVSLRLTTGTTRQIRVLDATGRKPVPGVFVRAGKRRWCAGRTSEDGLFAVPVLPGRREEVALLAEDGRQLAAWVEPAKGDEKGPRVMYLPALETLAGRVVSALDDRPIPGALVWSFDPGGFRRTGVDGGYRLELAPAPSLWIVAAAPGFLPMAVQAGRSGPTLALKPALTAGGVVVDEEGRPVVGVTIAALPENGGLIRTASDGRFRLQTLEAGKGYALKLSKPGFAAGLFQVPPLEAGRPVPDLRIVLYRGRAGFGRVVNQDQQPVPGADVILRPSVDALQAWTYQDFPQYTAATGANGRFEIRNLPAGIYELAAHGRGFAPLTVPGLTVPAGAGSTDLGTVVLQPGVPVEGFVVDPEGRPVAGAEVALTESSLDGMEISPGEEAPSAVSGVDGFFRIEDRREGETVDLTARHAGYAPGVAPGVRVPPEPAVRIALSPVAAIEGRTVDPDGRPVPRARVTVRPNERMRFDLETVSDESGFFRIETVVPGSVQLLAGAPGHQSALLKLDVLPGQELRGVEVLLVPGATVEGRVLSAAGKPVAGVSVFLVGAVSSVSSTSDGEGSYRLEGVPPGARTIAVYHQNRLVRRQVEVRMGSNTLDLTLDQGADVNGRVVVDQEGAPVANAWVRLRETSKNQDSGSATSRLDGSFTISGVEDGTYTLIAWKEGFAGSVDEPVVTVAGGSVDGIEVRLTPGGAIAGRLLGLDFPDLSRVQVWTDVDFQTGQVLPDGSYRIDHVLPGRRRVTAALAGGSRQAEGEIVVEAGASEARLDLEFAKGVVLTGRVLRNGEPVRRAVFLAAEANDNEEPASRGGETDLAGRFRFEGLDPGRYRLEIFGPESEGHYRKTLELSADLDLLIELPTGSIAGRVVDAVSREPIAHAQVALLPPGGASADGFVPAGTRTDSRGVFQLRGLAAGTWTVRAVLEGYAPAEVAVQTEADRAVEGLEIALQAATEAHRAE